MATATRLSVRTGIIGAWAVMLGVAVVVLVERLVSTLHESAATPSLAMAGVPVGGFVTSVLVGLYNGGSASVFVGILLIIVGWYQLLSLS